MFNNKLQKIAGVDYPRWWGFNLFWWKIEGMAPLNGLNVYKPSDKHSAGFVLKLGRFLLRARWSKRVKKMNFYCGFKSPWEAS